VPSFERFSNQEFEKREGKTPVNVEGYSMPSKLSNDHTGIQTARATMWVEPTDVESYGGHLPGYKCHGEDKHKPHFELR